MYCREIINAIACSRAAIGKGAVRRNYQFLLAVLLILSLHAPVRIL